MVLPGRAAVGTLTIAAGVLTIILSAEAPQRATGRGAGQASSPAFTPPRTPWGDPDLQGIRPSDQLVVGG